MLAAGVPDLGIGFLGVSLAFGLTVLTMAYAIGHISGCHLNPAVSIGLWAGGRFPANQLLPYIVSQVLGGIVAGGVYGLREGLLHTPSSRFKVKLNSVLNHCGRHGSRAGNVLGVASIMYSLYEGLADHYDLDQYTRPVVGEVPASPAFAALMTGVTFKATAGPRVAALAGTIGLGAVGATYALYGVAGIPYGSRGWMWL